MAHDPLRGGGGARRVVMSRRPPEKLLPAWYALELRRLGESRVRDLDTRGCAACREPISRSLALGNPATSKETAAQRDDACDDAVAAHECEGGLNL